MHFPAKKAPFRKCSAGSDLAIGGAKAGATLQKMWAKADFVAPARLRPDTRWSLNRLVGLLRGHLETTDSWRPNDAAPREALRFRQDRRRPRGRPVKAEGERRAAKSQGF